MAPCSRACSSQMAESNSARLMGAVPTCPTTTPAARLARWAVSKGSRPAASPAAKVAMTVSPAPETSKTSRATAGISRVPSGVKSTMPCSLRVRASRSSPSLLPQPGPGGQQGVAVLRVGPGGQGQFTAVGGNEGRARVAGEVLALGVHQHRDPVGAGGGDQGRAGLRAQDPLGIVRQQQGVEPGEAHGDRGDQALAVR